MSNPHSVQIHVTDHTFRPIEGALVSADDMSVHTDGNGRARLRISDGVSIKVEAYGYEGQERSIGLEEADRTQRFTLGRAGMPFFYRGKAKTPFEPLPGTIGVLTKPPERRGRKKTPQTRNRDLARRIGGRIVRSDNNFERSGVVVFRIEDGDDDALANGLRGLTSDPLVGAAGAVVRLSEHHASFLTDLVIARFIETVDDSSVAAIAGQFGLAPEGRFNALGNVHRLRFDGPATYAVIEAANALAESPEVVWAEPNLAATGEEDAVIPDDFLFLEQWDHQLINTPDAWQALRNLDAGRTFGDPDVVVAVVDNGIDDTHPELSGNVLGGNAKQVALFDFANMVGNMSNLSLAPGDAFRDHGTACASAAVGNTNNNSVVPGVGEGIAGVAGGCRIIGILRPGGTDADYAELYLWAAGFDPGSTTPGFPAQLARGADVITNSFGFNTDNPISGLMSDTFDRLTDDGRSGRGVLLFFSAGNDNVDLDTTFRRPWSMYDRCFGVAASTLANDGVTEIKAGYSNFGTTVDWCAPSNDNQGRHNPPGAFGAHSATIQAAPNGDAVCGNPAQRTTLAAAAAAGATTLTLTSAAGFAVGQAVLAGAAGGGSASGRLVNAVNLGANQITLDAGLGDPLSIGAPVAAGPRSYRTDFGGTSYATPVSAGAGALMLSANPRLRWDEVRDLIRATATKIDTGNTDPVGRWRDVNGLISTDAGYAGPNFSEFFGFGRLNAAAAVQAAGWRLALIIADAGNFGTVCVGCFEDESLTLSNCGINTISVTNIASSSAEFVVPGVFSYPLTIEAGNSLQVPIRFQPTGFGPKLATITVTSDPGGPQSVEVSGTAGAPDLVLMVADHGSFGDVCIGDFVDMPVTLSNAGHCALTVDAISSSSADFLVPSVLSYPMTIEAGNALQVPIRFQPNHIGPASSTITIQSNDPTGPKTVVVLGTAPAPALTLVVPDSGDFGEVRLGRFTDRDLVINNRGSCQLNVTGIVSSAPIFLTPQVVSFPLTVDGGDSIAVPIRFQPTDRGAATATLTIVSNDPNGPAVVNLSGTAWPPLPVAGSALQGFPLSNDSQHVFFVGTDKFVHELDITAGSVWDDNDLTTLAGAVPPIPAGALTGYRLSNDSKHVFFVGTDNHVYELYFTAGTDWVYNDLTSLARAVPPIPAGALTGYRLSNDSKHVFFVGTDNHVHELFIAAGGRWDDNDLTMLAGAVPPTPASALTGYRLSDDSQHVFFVGADNHVHELFIAGAGWNDNDLTMLAGAVPPTPASALTGYRLSDDSQHVFFVGADNHVHELFIAGAGWNDNDLTMLAGAVPPTPASALTGYRLSDDSQHVFFVGTDNHVHELFIAGAGWLDNDLTALT